MTPFQMANAECASLNNGKCDGMRIDDKLQQTQGKELTQCLLADGKRCDYFEDCVMPLAGIVTDPAKSRAYLAVAADYKFMHHISGLSRRCPECGGALPTHKRFCADCTAKHRRKVKHD